jgi:putative DNA primase/helicase
MTKITTDYHHDGPLDIAIGKSRKETALKNKVMLWSELVKKLSITHRTAETYSEYLAANKARQDEIKDIGGFVGGYLNGGRRKSGSIAHRQLITLDIDFAKDFFWDDFLIFYNNAACIYSTHKHSAETPRLRLIVPLDREVFADEYVAISRKIAGDLGINHFDHTTFQPERLMYWPSTSKDADYFFEFQDGPWMIADDILNRYHNWKDASEWAITDRESAIPKKSIDKQGDPLEKTGIVGTFCRTYTISEAIDTYLQDSYEPTDQDDRYTYKEGSTAAGLVVYDDKYAFSHHGTDPISGKLCNAFDLVRLHKFGLQDEEIKEGTPVNKFPSYQKMLEFAAEDTKVKAQLGLEHLQSIEDDFSDVNVDLNEAETDLTWMLKLKADKKGRYYSTTHNIITILENDPWLKNCIAFNEFEKREVALRKLPWRTITPSTKHLIDCDDAGLRNYLEKIYKITSVGKVKDALDLVLHANRFHPLLDYLNSLEWDGRTRLENLLIDYMGAENSEYIKAVTKKTFIAAVARIFSPGIKFDNVLTIIGNQGIGKSTLLGKLGKDWFTDSFNFHMLGKKDAFEQLQGAWIVEIGELTGLKKADVESAKSFLSKREDRYRVSYGKRLEYFPRQCVFIGTTNDSDFLRDPSGNRRFWPVDAGINQPTKNVHTDLDENEIDQIWAEAVKLHQAGEPLFLSEELEKIALQKQANHTEHDERTGLVTRYLNTLLPENWDEMDISERYRFVQEDPLQEEGTIKRNRVCVAEIWCELFGGHQKDMTSHSTKSIHNIMRTLKGWELSKAGKSRFPIYGIQKAYIRVNDELFVAAKKKNRGFIDA